MYICPNCGLKSAAQEWDIKNWENRRTINQAQLWNMAQEYNAKDKLREIAKVLREKGKDVYVFEKHKMNCVDTYLEDAPVMCSQIQNKTFKLYYGLCVVEADEEVRVIFECFEKTDPDTISLEKIEDLALRFLQDNV